MKFYSLPKVPANTRKRTIKWMKRFSGILLIVFGVWYLQCLPGRLFHDPTSTVLLDRNGNLLGAKIANDGQWRFEEGKSVPAKFRTCIIEFEDRSFYHHPGISAKGIGRAITQNLKHNRIVSGGSTITMQLARLMRKNPARSFPEKIIEMILATRIELRYSKSEILAFYSAHAPFGNNVVGLEAASWRYYGRSPEKLSWAESATLAVLPNAPGLIYPGKNHQRLLEKRNRLLKRLLEAGYMDETTFHLSLSEPLPDKPLPLPRLAPHLLGRLLKEGHEGKSIVSTIDLHLQKTGTELLQQHSLRLRENQIFNGAVIITSVKSGEVLAYIGNTRSDNQEQSCDVDCIAAPRSTGSILKPLLFEKALEDGIITPYTIMADIPTQYGSFSPKNFSLQYDGAVPVKKALARSLNVPMVRLLNAYGLEKFHHTLKTSGLTTIHKPARHYGLSLILGGAEAKLWDLNQVYTHLAQQLRYSKTSVIKYTPATGKHKTKQTINNFRGYSNACIYNTFDAMLEVNRPDEDGNWRIFSSSQQIAWKTGTSFGFRDAWAIGITPDYVVSVWIGNADGEGRPGLTGIKAAAPLLFDIFAQLPKSSSWFIAPRHEMQKVALCHQSGHRASALCNALDSVWIPKTCLVSEPCPYHQLVHLSADERYRVDSDCENVFNMKHVSWFVLPPLIEKYYKSNHPSYKQLPPYKSECLTKISENAMTLLYPRPKSKIYVPVEIDGETGRTIFEATHRNISTVIYWHMDDRFIGETKEIHQMALNPSPGKHKLLLIDQNGISVETTFEAIGKIQ